MVLETTAEMTKAEITQYLSELNDDLSAINVKGEICLYGGAVMAVAYDARPDTDDVDAVFKPPDEIRKAIARIAARHSLPPDWMNDAVKGFLVPHQQRILIDLPNLSVFIPEPDYLLAMKAISARPDTVDADDVEFLIGRLNITSPQEVFAIVEKYYARRRIKPATQFFIEELFEK